MSRSSVTNDLKQLPLIPSEIIRSEAVVTKLPTHNFKKSGDINISIKKRDEAGEIVLKWVVTYPQKKDKKEDLGQAGIQAYKLETVVINKKIDEIRSQGKKIPRILKIADSYRDILKKLGSKSGNTNDIKRALKQNASIFVDAVLPYKTKSGEDKLLQMFGTRYAIVLTGDKMKGEDLVADGVYVIFNDVYLAFLNMVQDRPLDYQYLKLLPASSQRFFELASFSIFGGIKYGNEEVTIHYSEYCQAAPQDQMSDYGAMKSQMNKLIRHHTNAEYIVKNSVRYEKKGKDDWLIHFKPGPRAYSQYKRFTRGAKRAASGSRKQLNAPNNFLSQEAKELVDYFYQIFHQVETSNPMKSELEFAQELIDQHGYKKAVSIVWHAKKVLEDSNSNYNPDNLLGIRPYLGRAAKKIEGNAKKKKEQKQKKEAEQKKEEQATLQDNQDEELLAQLSPEEYERFIQEAKEEIFAETPLMRKNPDGLIMNETAKSRVIKKLRERTQNANLSEDGSQIPTGQKTPS